MAIGCDLALQQELYDTVFAALEASALAGEVDLVTMPAVDQRLPYVFIGPSETNEHEIGWELFATIEVWSANDGTDQAKQIQEIVRTALHDKDSTTVDFEFTFIRQVSSELILDGDREAWQGTQRFRALASVIGS